MNAAILPASRKTSRAERLLWLEHEEEHISQVLHELTWKRQRYQEEARSLRMALTVEDRGLYRRSPIDGDGWGDAVCVNGRGLQAARSLSGPPSREAMRRGTGSCRRRGL